MQEWQRGSLRASEHFGANAAAYLRAGHHARSGRAAAAAAAGSCSLRCGRRLRRGCVRNVVGALPVRSQGSLGALQSGSALGCFSEVGAGKYVHSSRAPNRRWQLTLNPGAQRLGALVMLLANTLTAWRSMFSRTSAAKAPPLDVANRHHHPMGGIIGTPESKQMDHRCAFQLCSGVDAEGRCFFGPSRLLHSLLEACEALEALRSTGAQLLFAFVAF